MEDIFKNNSPPFCPSEEVFNEKPVRASTEKKKGMGAFLKDNDDGKEEKLIFDEDHFKKFLKEDNNNNENGTDG